MQNRVAYTPRIRFLLESVSSLENLEAAISQLVQTTKRRKEKNERQDGYGSCNSYGGRRGKQKPDEITTPVQKYAEATVCAAKSEHERDELSLCAYVYTR